MMMVWTLLWLVGRAIGRRLWYWEVCRANKKVWRT